MRCCECCKVLGTCGRPRIRARRQVESVSRGPSPDELAAQAADPRALLAAQDRVPGVEESWGAGEMVPDARSTLHCLCLSEIQGASVPIAQDEELSHRNNTEQVL